MHLAEAQSSFGIQRNGFLFRRLAKFCRFRFSFRQISSENEISLFVEFVISLISNTPNMNGVIAKLANCEIFPAKFCHFAISLNNFYPNVEFSPLKTWIYFYVLPQLQLIFRAVVQYPPYSHHSSLSLRTNFITLQASYLIQDTIQRQGHEI